jgi:hypothetical protein
MQIRHMKIIKTARAPFKSLGISTFSAGALFLCNAPAYSPIAGEYIKVYDAKIGASVKAPLFNKNAYVCLMFGLVSPNAMSYKLARSISREGLMRLWILAEIFFCASIACAQQNENVAGVGILIRFDENNGVMIDQVASGGPAAASTSCPTTEISIRTSVTIWNGGACKNSPDCIPNPVFRMDFGDAASYDVDR